MTKTKSVMNRLTVEQFQELVPECLSNYNYYVENGTIILEEPEED